MPPGLSNMGNTCYMNATVQCLGASRELRDGLKASLFVFCARFTRVRNPHGESARALGSAHAERCACRGLRVLTGVHATGRCRRKYACGSLAPSPPINTHHIVPRSPRRFLSALRPLLPARRALTHSLHRSSMPTRQAT